MTRSLQLTLAFIVGACAGSTSSLIADPAPAPEPASKPESAVPTPASEQIGTVVDLDAAERRRAPNDKGELAVLAHGSSAFLAQLELAPLAEIPPHRDPTEEYIFVISGGGTLLMDGRGHQLKPGSAVFMPANSEVSYANGPEKLVALQVFAGPASAAKYDNWTPIAKP